MAATLLGEMSSSCLAASTSGIPPPSSATADPLEVSISYLMHSMRAVVVVFAIACEGGSVRNLSMLPSISISARVIKLVQRRDKN